MTTPAEKDAMALATLAACEAYIDATDRYHDRAKKGSPLSEHREARAHLAARVAELEAERDEANERAARTAAQYQHEFEAHGQTIERADRAEAELAAGRVDGVRLDWMDANGFTAYRAIDPIDGISTHCVVVHETQKPRRGNVATTIRESIDAARGAG